MTENNDEPKALSPEDMRKIIEQERQGRIEACTREVQAVTKPIFEKYRCSLIGETVIRGNAVSSRPLVIAND